MRLTKLEEYFNNKLAQLDWDSISQTMHNHGFI